MSTNPTTKKPPTAQVEWLFWSAITAGLIVIYFGVNPRTAPPGTAKVPDALAFIGLLPLALSAAVRWMLLPRLPEPQKRLPIFILGVALAESCGLLGIFLGGPHKDTLFVLSLLGLAQFFPALLPRPASSTSPFR